MPERVLVIGLDCLGPELLTDASLAELPQLRTLVERGMSGPLASTLPPITVPAWTSMLSGRDPGELGIYGFRNRARFDYGELTFATSGQVRAPRLWDFLGAVGRRSVVVGVPQTSPPPEIVGELVAGFEGEGSAMPQTFPAGLAAEVAEVAGPYRFDVSGFRERERAEVLRDVIAMTERRVRLVTHLLQTREWDLSIWCEIGPDRIHHCFWSDHDPAHARHDPTSPYRRTIRDYYRLLDDCLGELLAVIPDECLVAVVSDHGAQPMQGGVCINEVLRRAGWLVLEREPVVPEPLDLANVNWSRTRAWAVGGYYARIFLNIAGREPQGVIPSMERDSAREALSALLARLELPGGPTITNEVLWPERSYRRVRGLPPDLMVFFGDCGWRSLGSVGHHAIWQTGNDTGLDEANHARDGLYVMCGRGIPPRRNLRASILDIAPTLLDWLGLDAPPDLGGCNLLRTRAVA